MTKGFDIVEEKVEAVPAGKQPLRLWLRILTCSNMLERGMRNLLKERFDTTLPRFDLMAALYRAPDEGLSMGELSRWLMVSNGNVTGVAERLEKEGLIARRAAQHDRRTQIVTMTPAGRAAFEVWAREHERWISGMLGDLSPDEMDQMIGLLAKAKASIAKHDKEDE